MTSRPAPWHAAPVPRWAAPCVLAGVIVAFALLPLVREPAFYYWDDTSAVFVPTWRAVGLDLLAGRWPTLRPDFWMGGNWAAEAQFGLWSPVNLMVCLLVALVPDLAVACAVIKIGLLLLLGMGSYLLLLEYGVAPRWAVPLAAALPFAGFTLFYDAATWVAGLGAYAWTPWFWWATRRCLDGRGNPLVVYVVGYLLVTNGSPYGVVAAVVVLAAVGVEGLLTRRWAGLGHLVLVGACVGTTAAVAYLPMALSAGAGWRGEYQGAVNDGSLVPNLTMLAGTSTPSQFPYMANAINRDPMLADAFPSSASSVPIAYTAWFLAPLLPWLPWRALRGRGRELAGVAVLLVVFGLLTLGPSQLWLFRWPVRLSPYVFLAGSIGVGVLLTAGPVRDAFRTRLAMSAGIVLLGGWIAWSQRPDLAGRHAAGTLLSAALVAALAVALRWRPALVPSVLVAGTGLVLACQVVWAPGNRDVMDWSFPTSAEPSPYAARYAEPVIQVARGLTVPMDERAATYEELLFGSQPGMVGVESTTSYTGIGFNAFSRALCLDFGGHTCPEGFDAVWAPAGSAVPVEHLVDAVKARTVVVQHSLVPQVGSFDPPPGWRRAAVTGFVTVFEREDDVPWPGSRLAAVAGDVRVVSATATDTSERVVVSTGAEGGAVQFARLAWPGYTATVDGRAVPVAENTQGLIELALPAGLADAPVQLSFRPPGFGLGTRLLVAGVVLACAQAVWVATGRGSGSRRVTARARGPVDTRFVPDQSRASHDADSFFT